MQRQLFSQFLYQTKGGRENLFINNLFYNLKLKIEDGTFDIFI